MLISQEIVLPNLLMNANCHDMKKALGAYFLLLYKMYIKVKFKVILDKFNLSFQKRFFFVFRQITFACTYHKLFII